MSNENVYNKKPAIVKFVGKESRGQFTYGKEYEAYLLEYWQGKRINLHARGDDGKITYFNTFESFEVISDEDNVLNLYEAVVECITHRFDDELLDIKYGKRYKAIGRDKDGMYLVMDESHDCYFYPPQDFKIIEDEHGILDYCSLYYSYCS